MALSNEELIEELSSKPIMPNKGRIQVIGHGIKLSKNASIRHLINLT